MVLVVVKRSASWLIFSGLSCLVLAACNFPGLSLHRAPEISGTPSATPAATETATLTATPTVTSSPTPSSTPTDTPTPQLLSLEHTPIPAVIKRLTTENAGQASGLAEWRQQTVTDLAWTPDGRVLAASDGQSIALYDVYARRVLRTLYPHVDGVVDIAFDPTGRWLVVGSRRGSQKEGFASGLELWQGPNWKPRGLLYTSEGALTSMSFSANGRNFAAAYTGPLTQQSNIDVWNAFSWEITGTLHTGPVLEIAFAPQGGLLAVTPDRYAIRVFDMNGEKWRYTLHTSFTDAVTKIAFSPDGLSLASGHYDGTLRLWDMQNGALLWTVKAEEVIESLAFSPDGALLATGGSYKNSLVRIYSAGSGVLLRTLEGHQNGVNAMQFSPDGVFLVSGSYDGVLRLWGIRP